MRDFLEFDSGRAPATNSAMASGNHSPLNTGSAYSTGTGRYDDKRMAHVGPQRGDYVQVTTFRYVGQGQGDMNMSAASGENGEHSDPCRTCCICFFVLLALVAGLWVVLPEHADIGQSLESFLVSGPTTATTTNVPSEIGGIELNIRVNDVDYPKVDEETRIRDKFAFAVKYATAFYYGHGVHMEHIAVDVDPRSELVHTYIVPPCGVNASKLARSMNFTSLGKAIEANLHTIGGWQRKTAEGVEVRVVNGQQFGADCARFKEELAAKIAIEDEEVLTTMTTTKPPREILIVSGAMGPSAALINGVFERQKEKLNNHMVLRKKEEPDVWIAFELSRWYITDTARKNDNAGGGWLYSMEVDSKTPTDVQRWQSWNGLSWAEEREISVRWDDGSENIAPTTGPEEALKEDLESGREEGPDSEDEGPLSEERGPGSEEEGPHSEERGPNSSVVGQ